MKRFSQRGEQKAILAWAAGANGSFLDLGCYDGVSYSNTAALADLGWSGLCIDAAPDAAAACAVHYRDNDNVDVLLAAFDPTPARGPAVVHWTPGDMNSSLLKGWPGQVPPVEILVPRVSHAWLRRKLAEMERPLFVSIDLEGTSLAALRWVLENVDSDCVCVEVYPDTSDHIGVDQAMPEWRHLLVNDSNSIYARVEVAA